MSNELTKTGERVIPGNFKSKEEYVMYLRHIFAYKFALKNINAGDSVLEVGSGEGYGTSMLSKRAGKVVGLDVDGDAINHASDKYKSKKCSFTLYEGGKIPFKESTFDAVISFQVIEHVVDDKLFVSEIYRVLKKGGSFIVATPNRNYRLKPNQKPWNRYHLREYSPESLREVLAEKFQSPKIWGVFGNSEVQKIEIDRVNKVRKIISLDPLGLRNILPENIKLSAAKVARFLSSNKEVEDKELSFVQKYSETDYRIEKQEITDSLDLIAVCKK